MVLLKPLEDLAGQIVLNGFYQKYSLQPPKPKIRNPGLHSDQNLLSSRTCAEIRARSLRAKVQL